MSGRSLWGIFKGTTENWLEDQASSISAALAFYCAFSLAPLLIIIVTHRRLDRRRRARVLLRRIQVTLLFGKPSADLILAGHAERAVGRRHVGDTVERRDAAHRRQHGVRRARKRAAAGLGRTHSRVPRSWRAFVRARLISFGFILAIGFLLLVSLTLTTALAALRGYVLRHFEGLVGMSRRWIS